MWKLFCHFPFIGLLSYELLSGSGLESVLIIIAVIVSHNLIVLVRLLFLFGLVHSAQVPRKGLDGWCTFMVL